MTEQGQASGPVRNPPSIRHGVGNRFVTGGFALALIIMIAIAVASYRSIADLRKDAGLIDRTRQVQIEIQDLAALSSAARIAWRSFLLTGSHSNVEEFEAAAKALPNQVELLRQLTADNPRGLQRISSYESVAAHDIDVMRDSMRKKEAGILATPDQLINELTTIRRSVGVLGQLTRDMMTDEEDLLAVRSKASETSARRTLLIILAGNVASIAVLLFAFDLLRREIGQRRDAEAALRKSEQHFRSVAQSANDAIISSDSGGQIIFWNAAAERIFGYSEDEILDKSLTLLMPGRYRSDHLSGLQRMLTGGESRVIGTTVELAAIRRDGTEFPVELSLSKWQSHGQFFFTGMIRDISERKQAEEELKRSEERFRLMVDTVGDYAIYMLDPEGRVTTWNAGAQRIKGYRPEEIIGKHYSCFYPADARAQGHPAHILELVKAQGRYEEEGYRMRKDGTSFWAHVTITAMRDAKRELRGFAKVTRDLSERKRAEEEVNKLNESLKRHAEELTAANDDLEAFSYSVAHDLRAPLRQVVGYAQILTEEYGQTLDPEAKRILDRVQAGGRHMAHLIEDLLHLAHVGRQPLTLRDTPLGPVVQSVIKELKPDHASRSIEWRIGDLSSLRCDTRLIRQVFINLLSNAVKYTRPREHAVIEVGEAMFDHQRALFVRDNGVGFDMKYATKLFGVFERLHKAREFEGTGVGLATVERIIRKHGGRVWVEAEPDRGATFYFTVGTSAATRGLGGLH